MSRARLIEEHLEVCPAAGINHEGINAEVAKANGNSRFSARAPKRRPTKLIARYILQRLTEKYGIDVEYHCKPLGDTDWNGSGMHANFSTDYMRQVGGKEYFEKLMKAFEDARADHIAVYGPGQSHASDRKTRNSVDRLFQLWRGRPRRVDPRAALIRQ